VAELGCAQDYAVAFHDRTGAVPVGTALEPTSVAWGRVLDDTSDAQAVVDLASPECCETLSSVRTWCNDMSLYRDGSLVWQGPVTEIEYVGDQVTISAKDVTAWLARRVIHTAMDFTTATGSGPADLASIAEALVRDAFAPDDPGVLAYLTVTLAGILGERAYDVNQGYTGDELRELARTGIDFTAIGHRILITGEGSLARLATLDDEHFAGPLRIVEDGLAATSRAIVIGEGIMAESGGVGPCGLIERLIKEDAIKDVDSAQSEADSLVAAGTPTPLYLEVPDGSQLTPDAPVGIEELVPGVTIPVASTQTCRDVSAVLRLTKLAVTFGSGGEAVAVTLTAPNASDD
jgi:hypothetical protein